MENVLVTSLVVSGLGVLLLFLALVALYVVMYLMPSVLREPSAAPKPEKPEEDRAPEVESVRLRAAAIAVAVARAVQETSPLGTAVEGEGSVTGGASSWWSFHHGRQLNRNPISRRRP